MLKRGSRFWKFHLYQGRLADNDVETILQTHVLYTQSLLFHDDIYISIFYLHDLQALFCRPFWINCGTVSNIYLLKQMGKHCYIEILVRHLYEVIPFLECQDLAQRCISVNACAPPFDWARRGYFRSEMSCYWKTVAAHGNGRTLFAMFFQTLASLRKNIPVIVLKIHWKRGIQKVFSRAKRSKYGFCLLAGNGKVANGDGQHWIGQPPR